LFGGAGIGAWCGKNRERKGVECGKSAESAQGQISLSDQT